MRREHPFGTAAGCPAGAIVGELAHSAPLLNPVPGESWKGRALKVRHDLIPLVDWWPGKVIWASRMMGASAQVRS
jgi:hypothetical protein